MSERGIERVMESAKGRGIKREREGDRQSGGKQGIERKRESEKKRARKACLLPACSMN